MSLDPEQGISAQLGRGGCQGQTWKQVAELQANRLANTADAERVIRWIRSDPRRAVLAFTEGPERQIAYAVEDDRLRRLGDEVIYPTKNLFESS